VVILNVNLEVPGKVIDALAEQRNLHFRRAGIGLMESELLNNAFPVMLSNLHVSSVRLLSFLFIY